MRRLRPRGLQARLTLWLLASVALLFGLHWLVTSRAPQAFTEEYVATRLQHDAESLMVGVHFDDGRLDVTPGDVAPIYERPYSGHYFVLRTGDQRVRSRSLWDSDLDLEGLAGDAGLVEMEGPRGEPLLVWSDVVHKRGRTVEVFVAEDLAPLEQRVATFRTRFTMVTLLLVAGLLLLQRLIVRLSLRPLDRVRDDCRRLEAGEIERLREDVPEELRPVVGEINRLLEVMQSRLERSRNALGNLAHAIKTPLTLVDQVSQRQRDRLGEADARQLAEGVARMREIVERELRRARLAGAGEPGEGFDAETELPRLVRVFRRMHADRELSFDVEVEAAGRFRGDREDMYELLGNLLDNAVKWASRRVRVHVEAGPGLVFEIEDDGPGVGAADRAGLAERGRRLDENRPGHGLGLAIVREIVELYGGRITFDTGGPLGGLRVRVALPSAPDDG